MTGNIVYYSVFYELGGYAVTAAAYVKALSTVPGIQVVPFNLHGRPEFTDPLVRALPCNTLPRTPFDLIIHKQPSAEDRTDPHLLNLINGARSITYITIFECDNIPPNWIAPLKIADRIIVPTSLCQKAFGRHFDRVRLVPYHVSLYAPEPLNLPHLKNDTLNFVSVISQATDRKGIDLLLFSYMLAFSRNDRVCLTVKVPCLLPDDDRFLRGCFGQVRYALRWKLAPPVHVIADTFSPGRMSALYRAHDIHVLLSRGEGFGLPFVEAALCGRPSIFPREGGHADFMRDGDAGWAVDGHWDTAATPVYPYDITECRWFVPSISSGIARFREVYNTWVCDADEIAKVYGQRAAQRMETFTDPKRIGDSLVSAISDA